MDGQVRRPGMTDPARTTGRGLPQPLACAHSRVAEAVALVHDILGYAEASSDGSHGSPLPYQSGE